MDETPPPGPSWTASRACLRWEEPHNCEDPPPGFTHVDGPRLCANCRDRARADAPN